MLDMLECSLSQVTLQLKTRNGGIKTVQWQKSSHTSERQIHSGPLGPKSRSHSLSRRLGKLGKQLENTINIAYHKVLLSY